MREGAFWSRPQFPRSMRKITPQKRHTCGYGLFQKQSNSTSTKGSFGENNVYSDDIAGFILQNKETIKILKLGGAW